MKMLKLSELLIKQLLAKVSSSSYSIEAIAKEKLESFRCHESNPLNHTQANHGQFYTMSTDVRKQLFQFGGIPKSFNIQTRTFNETCLMIRDPALDIIHCLSHINYSQPPVKFALYGDLGNGKTLSLAHVIHAGHLSGFLIVHVPWVGTWMRSCKEYSNSERKEGFVDINIDASIWLQHFKTQNVDLLNKPEFVTSNTYHWSAREFTELGTPLSELIDHGINRIKYACDTVTALAQEVKQLSRRGVCRTLVAIDGFNALFYPNTRVFTEKKERVPPSKITITEGFLELTKADWNNAVVVVTLDKHAIAKEDQISDYPKYLLGKDGFEHIDPFIPIQVSPYTAKEFVSCMDYYRERKWVKDLPGMDGELAFLSASNPYKLMQLCNGL